MTKQLEGLCPHDNLVTAYCEECAIEGTLYQYDKQIDWKALDRAVFYGVETLQQEEDQHDGYLQSLVDSVWPCDSHKTNEQKLTAQSILQEAINAISDRAPYRDADGKKTFELAAEVFNKLTAHDLTEYDACIFMACIKLARSQRGQFHVDDYTDCSSYIALAGEARAREVSPKGKRPEEI